MHKLCEFGHFPSRVLRQVCSAATRSPSRLTFTVDVPVHHSPPLSACLHRFGLQVFFFSPVIPSQWITEDGPIPKPHLRRPPPPDPDATVGSTKPVQADSFES